MPVFSQRYCFAIQNQSRPLSIILDYSVIAEKFNGDLVTELVEYGLVLEECINSNWTQMTYHNISTNQEEVIALARQMGEGCVTLSTAGDIIEDYLGRI